MWGATSVSQEEAVQYVMNAQGAHCANCKKWHWNASPWARYTTTCSHCHRTIVFTGESLSEGEDLPGGGSSLRGGAANFGSPSESDSGAPGVKAARSAVTRQEPGSIPAAPTSETLVLAASRTAGLSGRASVEGNDTERRVSDDLCPRCDGDAGDSWFDRSLCPCDDAMHTRCVGCGYALDGCSFEKESLLGERNPSATATEPQGPFPESDFEAEVELCGLHMKVTREGKHANFHVYQTVEDSIEDWVFEPLDQAIPKLEALLGAARLVANEGRVA